MKRIAFHVFVVFVAVLVVTTAPAAAAHTAPVSGHTTAAEFQAGTLDGLEVQGSGSDAYVQIASTARFSDGFEDEAADAGVPDNWTAEGVDGTIDVNTTRAQSGTQSLWGYNNQAGAIDIYPNGQPYSSPITERVALSMYVPSTDDVNRGPRLALLEGGTSGTRVVQVFIENGDLVANGGSTTIATAPDNDEWVTVIVHDFNISNNSYSVTWSDEAGNSGTETGIPMNNPMSSGWDVSRLRWGGGIGHVDEYQVGTGSTGDGTYISQNHTADNVQSGWTNLTLDNATATVTWQQASGGTWSDVASQTYSTSGNKSLAFTGDGPFRVNVTLENTSATYTARLNDEGVEAQTHTPTVDDQSLSPNTTSTTVDDPEVTLSGDVNDTDFPTDTLDVEFFLDGVSQGTKTANSNGTVSFDLGTTTGGDHTWHMEATDEYGHTTTSATAEFSYPGTLNIRRETSPYNKITSATATVRFYEGTEDDPTIVERTTSNGELDLTGLPTSTRFTVAMKADGYHNRTIVLSDLFSQRSVFILNTSRSSVENTFTVSDRTGDFPPSDTELVIEKAINRSEYDASADGFAWTRIAGDDLGASESFTVDLEQDDRYRLRVRNDDGDERILGAYTAATTGTVTLTIGSVVIDPDAPDTVAWNITRTNQTGLPVRVEVDYNDTAENTSTIWLHIYEQDNKSNELLANTSFSAGPYGTFSNIQPVPSDENDTVWVVELTAERENEILSATVILDGEHSVLSDMAPWLTTFLFVSVILMVTGLFSQLNGHVGGLVVAGLGAMFWFSGFAPDYLGGGVVILALITAGILYLRERGTPQL